MRLLWAWILRVSIAQELGMIFLKQDSGQNKESFPGNAMAITNNFCQSIFFTSYSLKIVKIVIMQDSVWIFRYFVERPGRCRRRILRMLEPSSSRSTCRMDCAVGTGEVPRCRGYGTVWVWLCVMDSIL